MKSIVIYHGSTKIIEKPVFGVGNPKNDYGLGFYCTENLELAKEWASTEQHDGYANRYEIDLEGLDILHLNQKPYPSQYLIRESYLLYLCRYYFLV